MFRFREFSDVKIFLALETRFVHSNHQLADIFTKSLSKALFLDLRLKLGLLFYPRHGLRGSVNTAENMESVSISDAAENMESVFISAAEISAA